LIDGQARPIRLILFDVDGVLTDGKILLHPDGTESKQFDIKDGTGIVLAHRAGLTVGFLSARTSRPTAQRAAQLGVTLLHQGVSSKIEAYEQIVHELLLDDEQVAYMGDDVVDLAVLDRAGLSAAPADAVEEVRSRVDWVSRCNGGQGAARELVELILRAQDNWDPLVEEYLAQRHGRRVPDTTERGARGSSEREGASEASRGGARRVLDEVARESAAGVEPDGDTK
jgi:3-deoxy-D-manno-octulosonate 8-phosphate phosphatase (KDO 8-P phosphatase)